MSLEDLKAQAIQLSTHQRLELISAVIQSLQHTTRSPNWQFLVSRPHPWRRQLYIKGRKVLASTLWQDVVAHQMTIAEAAENWDLPLTAVQEAMHYCEMNQDLLRLEAEEEQRRLQEGGLLLEPIPTR